MWPIISSNLAAPFTRYVVEDVWSCVVCDRSMIRLLVNGVGDNQERDPEDGSVKWRRTVTRAPSVLRILKEPGTRQVAQFVADNDPVLPRASR